MLRLPRFYYEGEGTGGSPPPAPVETPATQAPEQVAQHVSDAATSATEAAKETGEDGWKVVAEELRGLRGDIKTLIEKPATNFVGEPVKPASETPTEPQVEVETPKPQERKVRRGSRKVIKQVKHG